MKKLTLTIFMVVNVSIVSKGQGWQKIYCDTGLFGGAFAVESYDKGFLIGGSSSTNFENSVLYKTDINGNILWQRYIGEKGYNTKFEAARATADGGCVIVGETGKRDSFTMVFILKLNACGKMDWAKKIKVPDSLTTSNICITKDRGYEFNLERRSKFSGWLRKIDEKGNFVWSCFQVRQPLNISLDDSDNILITGYDYYELSHFGGPIPFNSVYITVLDSSANQILQSSNTDYRNIGKQTLPAGMGNYLTFGSDWGDSGSVTDLHLFLWDNNGRLLRNVFIKDKLHDNLPSNMVRTGIDSYILLATQEPGNMKTIKIDSDILVLKDTVYNYGLSMSPVTISATSDNKYIIAGSIIGNSSGIYAVKINSELRPDSFYTSNYKYDFNCIGNLEKIAQISLDSAPIIYTAIDEYLLQGGLSLYPNPVKDFINISITGLNSDAVQFSVYNTLGIKVLSSIFQGNGTGNLNQPVDFKKIPDGCYVVELYQQSKIWKGKIIVQH